MTLAHMILGAARDQDAHRCCALLQRYFGALLDCRHDDARRDAEADQVGVLHHDMVLEAAHVDCEVRRDDPTAISGAERLLALTELHWRHAPAWQLR
jgi:hypothetical protein